MSILIIAEVGVNHGGDVLKAVEMARCAKDAGADCVKFQTFISENLVCRHAKTAEYQKANAGFENQLEMLKRLELKPHDFVFIRDYCQEIGIEFMSAPFDNDSVDLLESLGVKRWKIPSGQITDLPYLEKIAKTKKPVIISTGMATLEEIEDTVKVFQKNKVTLLHCTTDYPAPFCDVNLSAIKTMREHFGVEVGYSDHTDGIEIAVAAATLGATVIEKHLTLSKTLSGPDHKASLEPEQFRYMVSSVRNVEAALGDGVKQVTPSDKRNINVARKCIVAKRDIKKGEIFSHDNIIAKRGGEGISPMKWYSVIGKTVPRDFKSDQPIETE